LTFDAGGAETGADRILATLKREGVPATFFLTGRFVERYPATARKIAAAHLIGNHTHTHPDLTKLSDDKVRMEIWTARAEIMDTTGKDPKPYFRFPYGEVDAHRIRLVNQECYISFRWTTDSLGWQGTSGGRSVESVTKRVLDGARPGGIVLMHVGTNPDDGSTLDADALPGIIAGLRAKGYRFVALDAVL
jgi:peptidoglycan/xylan/chitin deacetylase (PgdA/CDA1 family)